MGKYKTYSRKVVRQILGMIYPPRCPVCDDLLEAEDAVYYASSNTTRKEKSNCVRGIHSYCRERISCIEGPVCLHCGRPVDAEGVELCFDCQRKKNKGTRTFVQGKSLFMYQGAAKAMMYRFKYSNRREYAMYFARASQERFGNWIRQIAPEVIIPVPMYRGKERRRGYNQAAVFARELSYLLNIPYDQNVVSRIRNTQPMKNLNDVERKNNLKNAFQITNCGVKYKRVLLVDDIYTTGCTADEVVRTLWENGVDAVYFFCICIGKGF